MQPNPFSYAKGRGFDPSRDHKQERRSTVVLPNFWAAYQITASWTQQNRGEVGLIETPVASRAVFFSF
jgi:hypothetical protein